MKRSAVATVLALLTLGYVPTARGAEVCLGEHWLASWVASPSDASPPPNPTEAFELAGASVDMSWNLKRAFVNNTARVVITPHRGGSRLRLRLSNRFGTKPVRFARVTVAKHQSGAAVVPGSTVAVTFGGQPETTAMPGTDVVSDAATLRFRSFERLGVSVHITGAPGNPTEHYTGRQTSYTTLPLSGDHTADTGGAAFLLRTTTRPYLAGLDVEASRRVGGIVAFGDSITDGYQGTPTIIPESREGLDADGRWPDVLQRRLDAAGRPLAVVNAGISGNRILRDGAVGSGIPQYGPSGLSRLRADLIDQPGVTTAIVLEGGNDLGLTPPATADAVISGLRSYVERLHAARLRVLVGTITPAFGAPLLAGHGSAATEAARQTVNRWIRSSGVPDAVIDFDATVRDRGDPRRIDKSYDGSDHVHFNLAGYKAMAEAVPLGELHDPCQKACLAQRATIGSRGIGQVRLGYTRGRLLRRAVSPMRRTRYSYRYCVRGEDRGRLIAVFSRRSARGRVRLVAATARGYGHRGVRVGSSARSVRRAYPRRQRVGRGVFRASPSSGRVFAVRRGRVDFVAVGDDRLLRRPSELRRGLVRAGLRRSKAEG